MGLRRVGGGPMGGEVAAGGDPQAGVAAQVAEKLVEHLGAVGPAAVLRVQDHVEVAAPGILGGEFGAPVAGQEIGVVQAGALGGEHAEPLVVEMIVVRQGQQGAAGGGVGDPVMRDVVGQAVAEIRVSGIDQQVGIFETVAEAVT